MAKRLKPQHSLEPVLPIDDILNKPSDAISVEAITQKDTQLLVDEMIRIANGIALAQELN